MSLWWGRQESDSESDSDSDEEQPQQSERQSSPQRQQSPPVQQQQVVPRQVEIMGGSMCAASPMTTLTVAPGLQFDPSVQTMQQMAMPFSSQQGQIQQRAQQAQQQRQVPVTAQIVGRQNQDPQPFDSHGSSMGQLSSSYPIENEKERPMSNMPYNRTPILPFNRKSDTSAYDVDRSALQLQQHQGFDPDSWRPKREQGAMFSPQQEDIYGSPSQAAVQRDRYQPSFEMKHQTPFQAAWSLKTGGFHPTTRILPTHVPVLRQNLPTNYVPNTSLAQSHPSGLFGTERGELGLVQRKGTDLSFYYRVPFPTSAVNQAATQQPDVSDKPTNRQNTAQSYGGQANSNGAGAGANYVVGKYIMNAQKNPSQMHERLQQAGGIQLQEGGAAMTHFQDKARATRAELTEMATASSVSGVRAPIAAGYAAPMDVARTTRLELSEAMTRPTNIQSTALASAPAMYNMTAPDATMRQATECVFRQANNNGSMLLAPSVGFMDEQKATTRQLTESEIRAPSVQNGSLAAPMTYNMTPLRVTLAEGTELAGANSVSGVGSQISSAMVYLMDGAKNTLKQFTSDHSYAGGLADQVTNAPMNRSQYEETHLNEKLEQTNTVWRQPSQGPMGMVGTNADRVGAGDPSTVRVRDDALLNQWNPTPDQTGQGFERWIPRMTTDENLAHQERAVDERNTDSWLLGQLHTNPFALPPLYQPQLATCL